jgi:hypothetical protein
MTGATRERYYWLKMINQRTESHNKKDHEKKQQQRRTKERDRGRQRQGPKP